MLTGVASLIADRTGGVMSQLSEKEQRRKNCSYLNDTQHDGTLLMKSARQMPHPKMKT